MFGIVYTLISGIVALGDKVRIDYNDGKTRDAARERQNAGKNPSGTYYDYRGVERDINSGEIKHTIRDYDTHDAWVTNKYGDKIRNISEERRIQAAAYAAAIAPKGTKAIKYIPFTENIKRDLPKGDIFKGIDTGRLYVPRHFRWDVNTLKLLDGPKCYHEEMRVATFYMRIEDGLLEFNPDAKRYDYTTLEDQKNFMRYFNQRQKEGGYLCEHTDKSSLFYKEYYYCDKHWL